MSLSVKANNTTVSTDIPESGQHLAVLIGVIDLGTHDDTYQGKVKKAHKIFLLWELPDTKQSGTTNNHLIGEEFSLSFHKKSNLRIFVEGWRGSAFAENEEFDPKSLLGKQCVVNIEHKTNKAGDRTFAKLKSAARPMKGQTVPPATRPLIYYEIGGKDPVPTQDWLPYLWLASAEKRVPVKEVIEDSAEFRGEEAEIPDAPQQAGGPAPAIAGTNADPIPF